MSGRMSNEGMLTMRVINLFRLGNLDTQHIADRLGLAEAVVYNILARRAVRRRR